MAQNYAVPDKYEVMQCPYDDHPVYAYKFPLHLMKCRKVRMRSVSDLKTSVCANVQNHTWHQPK